MLECHFWLKMYGSTKSIFIVLFTKKYFFLGKIIRFLDICVVQANKYVYQIGVEYVGSTIKNSLETYCAA